jgi:molybdate transport system ATP-binding protein
MWVYSWWGRSLSCRRTTCVNVIYCCGLNGKATTTTSKSRPGTFQRLHERYSTNGSSSAAVPTTTLPQQRSVVVHDVHDDDNEWLVRFQKAILCYPNSNDDSDRTTRPPLDWTISASPSLPAGRRRRPLPRNGGGGGGGGHAILGANGTGKSLLLSALLASSSSSDKGPNESNSSSHVKDPFSIQHNSEYGRPLSMASVSFASHQALLQSYGHCSTFYALTLGQGHWTKAAMQFLTVRFGLYPLLTRDVATLSTGEIRKVLLLRALAQQPRLLLLDHALDGLDGSSRAAVSALVSSIMQGFRADILVQGVDVKAVTAAARTTVLVATHRADEIVDAISTVTMLGGNGGGDGGPNPQQQLHPAVTEPRNGRCGADLMAAAMGLTGNTCALEPHAWDSPDLPSEHAMAELWRDRHHHHHHHHHAPNSPPLRSGQEIVRLSNMNVHAGEKTLLAELDWTVRHGERWLVAGGNGAGKSSLMQLLTASLHSHNDQDRQRRRHDHCTGDLVVTVDSHGIGWVSTERHMSLALLHTSTTITTTAYTALEILSGIDLYVVPVASNVARQVAEWFHLSNTLLARPFGKLSQGEQKLVLLAGAMARRPDLLILDEPLQGLDVFNRRLVLGIMERLCRATDVTLIYVTHHFDELVPSLTNVLHLKDGRSAFNDKISAYNPNEH